jgi:hypothetical protein
MSCSLWKMWSWYVATVVYVLLLLLLLYSLATVFCLGCNSFPHFRSLLLVVIAFHLQCVATWLNSSRQTCPICRADWEYGQSSDQRRVSEQNP